MNFFNLFPKTIYDLKNDKNLRIVTDFFRHVTTKDFNIDDILEYDKYQILDGARPDDVSKKLYGRSDFHWTFFIINDHLRLDGLNAWPMSDETFRQWIDEEYGKYSVHVHNPSYNESANITIGDTTYLTLLDIDNYWGNIDYSNEYVLMRGNNDVTAKVVSYDFNTLQLWTHAFDGGDGYDFNAASSYTIEYTGPDDDVKENWLLSMIDYFFKAKQTLYYTFVDDFTTSGYRIYSQEYFDMFENDYLTQLSFSSNEEYYPAWKAPKYYIDIYNDDERVTPLYALDNELENSFVSYREYEEQKNIDNSAIKVISPQYIGEFAEAFKTKLNV